MPQVLGPLRAEEYAALKADIAKRGVLIPVEVDETTGEVLDGHHRLQACNELGIEAPTVRRYLNGTDPVEHALKLNLLRRHMGPIEWAQAFKRLLEVRGVDRGRGANQHSDTVSECAAELGVNERTARRRLELAEELADSPDLAEAVDRGDMPPKRARRVNREREAHKRATEEPAPELPAEIDVRHCDFRALALAESSVDLIFTDPPYPKEYMEEWSAFAEFASKALRPGRLAVVYTGQFWLPEVISRLSAHLTYVWCGTLVTSGPNNMVHPLRIRSGSKPLLFFSRGAYSADKWFTDTAYGEGRQKDLHDWQQAIGPARHFIESLTAPGALVVDPFLGAGTTALAAKETGRRFIGCDVSEVAVAMARGRLR